MIHKNFVWTLPAFFSALIALFSVSVAQGEEIRTFPENTVAVAAERWPHSTADKHFHLWAPEDTPVLKGLLVFVFHGDGQHFSEDAGLRGLAGELGCGVIGFDKFYGYPGGMHVSGGQNDSPASVLTDALKELAAVAGRPEVAHAPVITFGHSNATRFSAGFAAAAPERTIAWMAFKSAFGAQFSIPEIYGIPGVVMSGENDESYFSNQLATVRKLRHQHGALMHMIVEPGGGHGRNHGSYSILKAFMKTVFHLRVPGDSDPRRGPVKLNAVREADGWLGQTLDGVRVKPSKDVKRDWEQPVDTRRKLEIAPYAMYPGDKGFASWLPTGEYARKWQEFCMKADLPAWNEAVSPPDMTPEERFAQAQRLEASDPPAAATAYAALADTPYAQQAAARLADKEFVARCEARTLLRRLWVAEMSLGNMGPWGLPRDFHTQNADALAAISEAAAMLLERYPDTADATTVRLMLERYKITNP